MIGYNGANMAGIYGEIRWQGAGGGRHQCLRTGEAWTR